ncbi:CPBP family intramembrane glutamic endopeptidase [Streptococcus sobrinus]|uniref:CPBP family intramembrane glutamic endopeptidase n=2 Tax=Streptococcus sobrinus TaxID=1310 RepID=UPI0003741E3F
MPQKLLFNGKSKVLAGVVTSFIFAILHVNTILELILYLPLGVVLYLAYQHRGNLKDSMMVYALNNLPTAIIFLLTALGIIN